MTTSAHAQNNTGEYLNEITFFLFLCHDWNVPVAFFFCRQKKEIFDWESFRFGGISNLIIAGRPHSRERGLYASFRSVW